MARILPVSQHRTFKNAKAVCTEGERPKQCAHGRNHVVHTDCPPSEPYTASSSQGTDQRKRCNGPRFAARSRYSRVNHSSDHVPKDCEGDDKASHERNLTNSFQRVREQ